MINFQATISQIKGWKIKHVMSRGYVKKYMHDMILVFHKEWESPFAHFNFRHLLEVFQNLEAKLRGEANA